MMPSFYEATMTTLSPFSSINCGCDQALHKTKAGLAQAGLSTMPTFNLYTARLGFHNCCCPNHGTEACDCQMIVLLVYGEAPEPATLVLHGNNGQTWISIADSALQRPDAKLVSRIRRVLETVTTAP
jgi:hypothetical protein